MIATGAAVNAVAVLVLAVMSYVLAHLILSGVAAFDAWMDPSRKRGGDLLEADEGLNQPSYPTRSI